MTILPHHTTPHHHHHLSIFLEARGPPPADAAGAAAAANFTEVAGRPIKDETEYRQVRRAVAACPFQAIRLRRGAKGRALEAGPGEGDVNAAYPFPVSNESDVFLLGFYSPKTAGKCGRAGVRAGERVVALARLPKNKLT